MARLLFDLSITHPLNVECLNTCLLDAVSLYVMYIYKLVEFIDSM